MILKIRRKFQFSTFWENFVLPKLFATVSHSIDDTRNIKWGPFGKLKFFKKLHNAKNKLLGYGKNINPNKYVKIGICIIFPEFWTLAFGTKWSLGIKEKKHHEKSL